MERQWLIFLCIVAQSECVDLCPRVGGTGFQYSQPSGETWTEGKAHLFLLLRYIHRARCIFASISVFPITVYLKIKYVSRVNSATQLTMVAHTTIHI
ncbi:hypothetical protein B0H63DRAFT_457450 [Podospora didyma]|uniref:Secreted protein n=1 Tax=Podospora didyma TaxID=330526 RepID=A0AAE0U770_9PEZI|nr:hypothetical protein B0H63DRAFT_457450 [Podospora didyma]